MKQFLLIPDKFKGSLDTSDVIFAMKTGIKNTLPGAQLECIWAADGGDGFLDAIAKYKPVVKIMSSTVDPLGRKLNAPLLFNDKAKTAYVELAQASGLILLKEDERNPAITSTYGTGLQIKHAIALGAKYIYIGLGGSATNDAGCGLAAALGYSFLNDRSEEFIPNGENLNQIKQIVRSNTYDDVTFFAVNDVTNPLFGKNGAAYIYAEQKGANKEKIITLDNKLKTLDTTIQQELGKAFAYIKGAGAAGGTAYGLKTFFDADFLDGIDFILNLTKVTSLLKEKNFDYIFTGEGKIDYQTLKGKFISGIVAKGNEYNIPVIAFCGKLELSKEEYQSHGISDILEIRNPQKDLRFNMENASELLKQSVVDFCNHLY